MKVVVNYDLCEGYARCMEAAPEVFDAEGFNQARVLIERPGEELREKVAKAVRTCPRQAISLVEDAHS